MLEKLVEALTSRRVKEINRIVGRASNVMPESKYWTREIPDYQQHLAEYTFCKRQLGLLKKRYVSGLLRDEEVLYYTRRIEELTEFVKHARELARKLRHDVWYGHFDND